MIEEPSLVLCFSKNGEEQIACLFLNYYLDIFGIVWIFLYPVTILIHHLLEMRCQLGTRSKHY